MTAQGWEWILLSGALLVCLGLPLGGIWLTEVLQQWKGRRKSEERRRRNREWVARLRASPAIAQLTPPWQPTALTVAVTYDRPQRSSAFITNHPNARAVWNARCILTDEIHRAAQQVGVGSRSVNRCLKKLRRTTGDDRWAVVAKNLDHLTHLALSDSVKAVEYTRVIPPARGGAGGIVVHSYSVITDTIVTHYQPAVETTRAEIRRLTCDFLRTSAPS